MVALTVHNAEVRTASVEVKMLTLRGKQVTVTVFRQLQERPLIAADGTLNGVPWGIVNHHPDKCADAPEHLHVVWQRGSDLHRCGVPMAVTFPSWIDVQHGQGWADAALHAAASGGSGYEPPDSDEFLRVVSGVTVRILLSTEARRVQTLRSELAVHQADAKKHGLDHEVRRATRTPGSGFQWTVTPIGRLIDELTVDLGQALSRIQPEALPIAEQLLREEVRVEAERRDRHRDVRKALADLPQLFIGG